MFAWIASRAVHIHYPHMPSITTRAILRILQVLEPNDEAYRAVIRGARGGEDYREPPKISTKKPKKNQGH